MSDWSARRFWTSVRVAPVAGGFGILLDGRPALTPARAPLAVPGAPLARAIAEEWEAQGDRIAPAAMPLSRMANTAIDRLGAQHGAVVAMLAAYGESDLLCHRAPGPDALVHRQARLWDPVLGWASEALDAPLVVTRGVIAVPQPPDSLSRLAAAVARLDRFELAAFHDLVTISGSLVLALALERGRLDVVEAGQLATLDEDWQAEQWGRDDEAARQAAARARGFEAAHRFLSLHRGCETRATER